MKLNFLCENQYEYFKMSFYTHNLSTLLFGAYFWDYVCFYVCLLFCCGALSLSSLSLSLSLCVYVCVCRL